MNFFSNILITFGSGLGMTLLSLLTGVLLARTLGPTGRGLMVAVLIWPQILVWAGGLSLGYSNIYFGAAAPASRRGLFANSFWAALLLGSVTGLAASFLLPHSLPLTDQQRRLLMISLVLLPLSLWSDYGISLLQGTSRFDRLTLVKIAAPMLTAVCLLLCGATHTLTVTTAVVSSWLGSWLSAALALRVLAREGYLSFRPNPALLRRSLAYSLRIHLGSLAGLANGRLDQLLMTALVAPRALGLYAFAVTLSEMLRQIAIAITTVLYPRVAGEATLEDRKNVAIRTTRWMLLIGCASGGFMSLLVPLVVPLLWGSKFISAIPTIRILLPGTVALSLAITMAASLHGAGRPGVSTIAEIASLIVMVPLLYLLLPRMGIFGAGLASTCGYGVNCLVMTGYFAQTFGKSSLLALRPTRNDWEEANIIFRKTRASLLARIPASEPA